MLHQVAEYARRQELAAEPGFAPKAARWAILCTGRGVYLGVVELGDTTLKKNPGWRFLKAPYLSQPEMKAGGVTKSHFLIDTAGVVACYGKDAPKEKHGYFVGLMEQAETAMPVLGVAAEMLRRDEDLVRLRNDLEERKARATDKVTFQIDGEFPAESDAWHDWWREFRRGLQTSKRGRKEESMQMLCFLTGEAVEPAATHPKIKGLRSVGGHPAEDVLISFKQESFQSYGLRQSANAAMPELAAKAYQAGLNDLIADHSAELVGAKVVHWFRNRIAKEEDPLAFLTWSDETEELNAQIRARELLNGVRSGKRPDLANNTYYALTISANGGRVVVRDWMEGSFEELVANVDQWFSDLEIVRSDGPGSAQPPKLVALLAALVRDLKKMSREERLHRLARMETKLFRAAAKGELVPFEAMAQALARARSTLSRANGRTTRALD